MWQEKTPATAGLSQREFTKKDSVVVGVFPTTRGAFTKSSEL